MIQKPKGTYDIYNSNAEKILYLRKLLNSVMDKYNYKYIETPIIESSELFHRVVGETSDIVSKETYDFIDRGNRKLSLRPEGTAGIVRSINENKLYINSLPLKLWYFGPMFRYERPQAGRNRQFNQFGIEAFGIDDPIMDAEVISIAVNIFKLLGLNNIKVNINTIGDIPSRENYKKALIDYIKPHLSQLCEDCKNRYNKNPLRILDCKIDNKKDIIVKAPKIKDYLNEESQNHFSKVLEYLDELEIEYVINDNLVRGLDYYTHTVFEIESSDNKLGTQNTLCAGGRYNNLSQTLGGQNISGVGLAFGIERLLLALDESAFKIDNNPDIYIMSMLEDKKTQLRLANYLRMSGYNVELDYIGRNIKNNFKHAEKLKTKFIIILGEDEISNNYITVKNSITKEQQIIENDKIIEFFDKNLGEEI